LLECLHFVDVGAVTEQCKAMCGRDCRAEVLHWRCNGSRRNCLWAWQHRGSYSPLGCQV